MSGPPGKSLEDNFAAPLSKKGIRILTAGNIRDIGESTTSTSRKRKWSPVALNDLLENPFPIRAHPSSLFDETRRLTPLLLLPRSCLPLSFLDPGSASTAISQSRLFSAYVRALEHEEAKDQVSAVVVVAELEPDRSLYAVERVRQGLYALCKIGKWVNIGDLRAAALAIRKGATRYKRKPSSFQESKGWWDATAVDPFNDAEGPAVKKLRVHPSGPIQFNMRPSLSGTLPKSHDCDNVAVPVESGAAMDPLITPASGPEEVQCTTGPCAQELFDTLRSQYLEALYLSKTSLAYFVKGPLSRARANIHTGQKAGTALSEFVDLLRSSILSLTVFDKKYREAVPHMIQALPVANFSDDENNADSQITNKRKYKKKRIGKDGLYPGEHEYITQWWRARDLDSHNASSNENRDNEAKRCTVDLRTRETQLQLILILEVIALEASLAEAANHHESHEQGSQGRDLEGSHTKKRRPKKRQDLNLLLELLIDRLSIWQSVSVPAAKPRPSKSSDTSTNRQHVQNGQSGMVGIGSSTPGDDERLREFCAEVIAPFYAARLPECCSTISQKLGVVKPASPVRPRLAKSASTSQGLPRPGTVVKRTMTQSFNALEPASTFEKPASRRQQPSLLRCATAPAVPGLKRESSEASMSDIPLRRQSVEKSKRYSQREVDLNAISHATEMKLKRKALVEEELKGAIATLKKPNRCLAVKEFVESIEQRVPTTGVSSRKPKHPVRNPFGQGVQVTATPKGNRRKNVFGRTPVAARERSPELEDVPHNILCGGLHIPSSVMRPAMVSPSSNSEFHKPQNQPRPVRQNVLSSVAQTPTRGLSKLINVLPDIQCDRQEDELCLKSSSRRTFSKPIQTPSKENRTVPFTAAEPAFYLHETPPRQSKSSGPSKSTFESVSATPLQVKGSSSSYPQSGVAGDHRKPLQEAHNSERSNTIYESLGWDDDADDLL